MDGSGYQFELSIDGRQPSTSFAFFREPITVCVRLSGGDIDAAKHGSNVHLLHHEAYHGWVPLLDPVVDLESATACGKTISLSVFALVVAKTELCTIPERITPTPVAPAGPTAAPQPTPAPMRTPSAPPLEKSVIDTPSRHSEDESAKLRKSPTEYRLIYESLRPTTPASFSARVNVRLTGRALMGFALLNKETGSWHYVLLDPAANLKVWELPPENRRFVSKFAQSFSTIIRSEGWNELRVTVHRNLLWVHVNGHSVHVDGVDVGGTLRLVRVQEGSWPDPIDPKFEKLQIQKLAVDDDPLDRPPTIIYGTVGEAN